MLAKLTSKNQLTLPKAAVEAVTPATYFEVAVEDGRIVLTPVRIQRGDAVRAKLAALELTENDVAAAVRWLRTAGASHVAEASTSYKPVSRTTRKQTRRGKTARRP